MMLFFYDIFQRVHAFARKVFFLIYYIPKFNRPNAAWSHKTSLVTQILKELVRHRVAIRYRTPKSLEPGSEGDQFIVLSPQNTITNHDNGDLSSAVYTGSLTAIPTIQPVPIGAVWFPDAPSPNVPLQRLVIHFHPSGFVLFGPRKADGVSWGPTKFGQLSEWPVLSVQYRLSLDKDKTTFPAAIQDAITAYVYALETLKIPAENIVLSGESAGGNLVVAMIRYIRMENPALPLPRAGLLWSPWLNMTRESILGLDTHRNASTDYIETGFCQWGAESYIPSGWSEHNPYFTPLGNEFRSNVPLFIEAGTSEVLYDDIVQFARNMKNKGTDVELHEALNAPHSIFSVGEVFGMTDIAIDGHARAIRFITRAGDK
ncbi:Alpha/Beta hydrolase protein [Penicillium angulare]|uniref:Alpha/Beta hydrolase protein n=1 Tax=Penicillium angulare TaxID=116970 RepID=UPI00254026E4|nr:Alpha/Beta hydrolase protein [Penicillium angulare]KAJ5280433.1 Alpha/Beta hydrolase protein [Penicillium angulare]